jgi:DNA end-binding protein Ku
VPATAWRGHLTFGLISIPIRLYAAARKEGIRLHQIHTTCHTRIRQPLFCPTCNRIVERSEVVKGYEYEKDQYALVTGEEVKKIAPRSERTMEILEFVKLGEIDPLYFHASYLAVPETAGRKPYELLVKTLEYSGRAAIAKVAMHQRDYLITIRPHENGLTLHTMYFADEIRKTSDYGKADHIELKPQEVKLARQLVESLSAPFEPQKYHDEYEARLKDLVATKQKGKQTTVAPQPTLAPVVDMMEALKKSLAARESAPRKRPARTAGLENGKRLRNRAS